MAYYRTLHLEKEPFSNSPDPGLFFNARQHLTALQKLEIAIRLRRGLNVITGDVGTGKTTVCRQLIRKIDNDEKIRCFLILDPGFTSPAEFLAWILYHFTGLPLPADQHGNELALKEKIKANLFSTGVEDDVTTVLLIDEGQKLPLYCLETLRELLNYETNDKKLLQIVIFAQKEFDRMIAGMENFVDRINFRFTFSPLSFAETRDLIRFRINQAASPDYFDDDQLPRFTFSGFWAVYRITKGYPRKIINLCHHVLLTMIIQDRQCVGSFFVHACAGEIFPDYQKKIKRFLIPALSVFAMVLIFFIAFHANTIVQVMPEPVQQRVVQWVSSDSSNVQHADAGPAPAPVTLEVVKKSPAPAQPDNPPLATIVQPETRALVQPDPDIQQPVLDKTAECEPNFLGSVKISGEDNLYAMISIIYGSYSKKLLRQVMQDNGSIKDPSLILNGALICFRVVSDASAHWRSGRICLTSDSSGDLSHAYVKAREYRKQGLNIRILSSWSAEKGFMFYVVLNQVFADKPAAQAVAAKLSESFCEFRETEISALVEGRTIL
ncbi:ExeA family protein [Desulfobacter vibrioformis]|uniref:ExeA family protein n=1 Tax=Desulfobacter vibrioformis TaxID=34031 RepID=UPI000689EEA6|nr:AAA family ATPase [Desulfobacter vibrioformis]